MLNKSNIIMNLNTKELYICLKCKRLYKLTKLEYMERLGKCNKCQGQLSSITKY